MCLSEARVRLLICDSNLGHISAVTEIQRLSLLAKIANFFYPLSFSALVRGDPFQIYRKALQILKQQFSRQPTVKIW